MKLFRIFILFFVIYSLPYFANASVTSGTIPADSYAWGENIGWINFGCANCHVLVTDDKIIGYAWSARYGWINLSPTQGGVTNDANGNLNGNAWSASLGWINFNGVVINNSGKFTGITGSQSSTAGRINFNCANCLVSTDWRPINTRNPIATQSTASTNSSGSYVGIIPNISNNNSSTTQPAVINSNEDYPKPVTIGQIPTNNSEITSNNTSSTSIPEIVSKNTKDNTNSSSTLVKIVNNNTFQNNIIKYSSLFLVLLILFFAIKFIL